MSDNKTNLDLFNSILNDDSIDDLLIDNRNENVCLISNSNLENNYITLDCNHKFNYMPLFNEIVYQKTKKILDNARLRLNEIKLNRT